MDGVCIFSIFISNIKFLGDKSSKQVASILNDQDSECVKCFWPMSVGPWATFQTRIVKFSMKNVIRLIMAGFTLTFDTICLCRHNSISFSCVIYKSRVSKCY